MKDGDKGVIANMRVDEETGLPLVGGPLDPPTEELLEMPLAPQMIVALKKAEEVRAESEAFAANVGLAVLDVLRTGFRALKTFEDAKVEQSRVFDRAAKSTGVGVQRVRGFDMERGVVTYTKAKSN